MTTAPQPETGPDPAQGWHCTHFFYRWNRSRLASLDAETLAAGRRQFAASLDPAAPESPIRLQTFVVSGHKADFGVLALDGDPLKVDGVHHRLLSGPLGVALETTWSFVSMTEVSEYLPTVEEYRERLAAEGLADDSDSFRSQVQAYQRRLEIIRRQRIEPDLPTWPAICFYPMNKRRQSGANWFRLEFAERQRLMSEHGETGMKFAGKVTQMVTGGFGLDDWEWGVTLWARNPQFLKEIVYRMRFDEASARYGEFGPFCVGYLRSPAEILEHCRITD